MTTRANAATGGGRRATNAAKGYTGSQILLKQHLGELGIETVHEHRFDPSRRFRFDLASLEHRLGFECNGHWQGRHGSGWSGEAEKMNMAQAMGWRVFVFHNRDVLSGKAKQWVQDNLLEGIRL